MGRYWDEDAIFHHGIKGQKWGVKNGPPYPLSGKKHNAVIKKAKKSSAKQGVSEVAITLGVYGAIYAAIFGSLAISAARREAAVKKIYKDKIAKRNGPIDAKTGLHKKSKEYTPEQDAKEVNPAFNKGTTNTRVNCAYCSTAYELRRRGYDVMANTSKEPVGTKELYQSYFKGAKRETASSCSSFFNPDAVYFKDVIKPGKQEEASKAMKLAMVGENRGAAKKTISEIKSKGNSRGFVTLTWPMGGSHVINYEVKGGKVTFIDSQCGKTFTGKDAEDLFATSFASTYYRMDNCELNIDKIKREAIR